MTRRRPTSLEARGIVVDIQRALELTRNSAVLSSLREERARRIDGLTPRERQLMKLVVEGNPNAAAGKWRSRFRRGHVARASVETEFS
jgi:FixJ family two-component response regulator